MNAMMQKNWITPTKSEYNLAAVGHVVVTVQLSCCCSPGEVMVAVMSKTVVLWKVWSSSGSIQQWQCPRSTILRIIGGQVQVISPPGQ